MPKKHAEPTIEQVKDAIGIIEQWLVEIEKRPDRAVRYAALAYAQCYRLRSLVSKMQSEGVGYEHGFSDGYEAFRDEIAEKIRSLE